MPKPIEVEVRDNVEYALKVLKKKMGYEGVFRELKKRRYHEKPSEKRARKKKEADRRRIKRSRRIFSKKPGNRRY